jgi:hypothetical protein
MTDHPGQDRDDRAVAIAAFEADAETIAVHTWDLLSQLESQLRAVRRTQRFTDTLRSAKHRVGPELTNGARAQALSNLAGEISAIDHELQAQHRSCEDMALTIRQMQARLHGLKARLLEHNGDPHV